MGPLVRSAGVAVALRAVTGAASSACAYGARISADAGDLLGAGRRARRVERDPGGEHFLGGCATASWPSIAARPTRANIAAGPGVRRRTAGGRESRPGRTPASAGVRANRPSTSGCRACSHCRQKWTYQRPIGSRQGSSYQASRRTTASADEHSFVRGQTRSRPCWPRPPPQALHSMSQLWHARMTIIRSVRGYF